MQIKSMTLNRPNLIYSRLELRSQCPNQGASPLDLPTPSTQINLVIVDSVIYIQSVYVQSHL